MSRGVFVLGANVHANVRALREYLGSVDDALSLLKLAKRLNAKDGARRSASMIQRWERNAQPDYESTALMADMAGVSFEEFAFGTSGRPLDRPALQVIEGGRVLEREAMGIHEDVTPGRKSKPAKRRRRAQNGR